MSCYFLQQQHLHQMASSSSGERTSSSIATAMNTSDVSPPRSFTTTSSGYSSSADYSSGSILNSKPGLNNGNGPNTNATTTNINTTTANMSSHSPYDSTSTATTSSSPSSTGYLTTTVKQETMMPTPFTVDSHTNYGKKKIR